MKVCQPSRKHWLISFLGASLLAAPWIYIGQRFSTDPLSYFRHPIRPISTFQAHENFLSGLRFSVDGKNLITQRSSFTFQGRDTRIKLWDPQTQDLLRILDDPTVRLNALAISDDQCWFLTVGMSESDEAVLTIWDSESNPPQQAHTQILASKYPYHIAISPDEQTFWITSWNGLEHSSTASLFIGDIASGRITRSFKSLPTAHGLALSPDNTTFAMVDHDRTLSLWDVTTGKQLYRHQLAPVTATEDRGGRRKVIFSADGSLLVTSDGYSLQLWHAATGEPLQTLFERSPSSKPARWGGGGLAISADNAWVASGGERLEQIHLWDRRTGVLLRSFDSPGFLTHLTFSPDSKVLAGSDIEGRVTLWALPQKLPAFGSNVPFIRQRR